MRVFVINLKRDVQRRRFIVSQLEKLGLTYTIIDAIDGNELSDEAYESSVDVAAIADKAKWITKGAVGCALSHLQVYNLMVADAIPHALVLEDDCILGNDILNVLEDVPKQLSDNEVLLLDYKSWDEILLKVKFPFSLGRKYHICETPQSISIGSSAAYIITQGAAARLAKNVFPVRASADHWHFFLTNGYIEKIRLIYPFVVKTAYFKSSIDYLKGSSFVGLVSKFINEYNIFPLNSLLKYRRKRLQNKLQRVRVVS